MDSREAWVGYDSTGQLWDEVMRTMLTESSSIIALRGAGSYNGISVADANGILERELIPRVDRYRRDGDISIIFDGDDDDPEYPDIGHIAGRLRDHFDGKVNFYAVQKLGWYRYSEGLPAMRPLHSAKGNPYRTILFPDDIFRGDHDHFSQNRKLTRSYKYEQWYVGACGEIASRQLIHYSAEANDLQHCKALVFKAPVSVEQGRKIQQRLEVATDPAVVERLQASLARRQANPYGVLFTPEGDFIRHEAISNLKIKVIG